MKTIIWIVIVLIILGAGWYFLGPLVRTDEVNEDFPTLDEVRQMSDEEKALLQDEMMEHAAIQPPTVVEEGLETGPISLAGGTFVGADNFHQGSGSATLYRLEDNTSLLRFEDFNVTNGPDLHVILSSHADPSNQNELKGGDYIDLGSLKGNVGNQNYEIPENVDATLFNSVVIYCEPFHVIFSVASLSATN